MTTSNPKLNKVTRVEFYPFTHQYILDGEKALIGVTCLMRNQGLSPDYSFIDQDVLDHAADLGTQAHEAIEAYCNGETTPDIPLIKSFKKLGLDIIATEYLVTDYEVVASSIDLVAKVDDNTVDLIDMKRTDTSPPTYEHYENESTWIPPIVTRRDSPHINLFRLHAPMADGSHRSGTRQSHPIGEPTR